MHSGEMFRKLNNFTNVPLVCDDGSVILAHKVHFFINILFLFSELSTPTEYRPQFHEARFHSRWRFSSRDC